MQQKMGVIKAESNDGWEIVFKLLSPQTTEISLLSHSHSYFITLSPQKKRRYFSPIIRQPSCVTVVPI